MDYVVELNFEGPGFVAVPNHVAEDERLSAEALGVLVYLARLKGARPDAIVRVGAIRARFGWGKDKWQRVARELHAIGAACTQELRDDETGRVYGRSVSVGWPQKTEGRKTRLSENRGPENPALGPENPAQVSRKTRPLKRDQSRGVAARKASESGDASGAVPVEKVDETSEVLRKRIELAKISEEFTGGFVTYGGERMHHHEAEALLARLDC